MSFYSINHYFQFYLKAVTKYQLHSPAIFQLVMALLEDSRRYYAFDDIRRMRQALLQRKQEHQLRLSEHIRAYAPAQRTGERLFRLVQYVAPNRTIMLGSGAGLGCLYAAAASSGPILMYEAQTSIEKLAQLNLTFLHLDKRVTFVQNAQALLDQVTNQDMLISFADDTYMVPTGLSHMPKVAVGLGMYSSELRYQICQHWNQHPGLKASVDFFDLTVWLMEEGMRELQHVKVVPAWYKPWKFY
ncbi:MAG TPA: hypothetical protein DCF33_00960 [Saprospirales bacterium]|nr:hypothetical protein [Saprospirales bacterium]